MSHCVYRPNALGKEKGNPSNLHKDLTEYFDSREVANDVWATAVAMHDDLHNIEGAEFDSNGEITISSLDKIFDLKSLGESKNLRFEKEEANAVDKSGYPKEYSSMEAAIAEISKHGNLQDKGLELYPVASANEYGSFNIVVEKRTAENMDKLEEAQFQSRLNQHLLSILKDLGFTTIYDNNIKNAIGKASGVFDPRNAPVTAEGLKAVIRISKGEMGETKFPEEFSHAIIRGMREHPLVQRLISQIRNTGIEESVLGEEYEDNRRLYDDEHLAEEVAGRLLQSEITKNFNRKEYSGLRRLLSRIWEAAKSLFARLNESDIDRAVREASKVANQVAEIVESDSLKDAFNPDYYLKDLTPMYNTTGIDEALKNVNKMGKVATKMLDILDKKMRINMENGSLYTRQDKDTHRAMDAAIKSQKYTLAISLYLDNLLTKLKTTYQDLETRKKYSKGTNEANLILISANAVELKSMLENEHALVGKVTNIRTLAEECGVELSEVAAKSIEGMTTQINNILAGAMDLLNEMNLYVTTRLMLPIADDVLDATTDLEKIQALEDLYSRYNKDISVPQALLYGLSEQNDPAFSLIGKYLNYKRQERDSLIRSVLQEIRKIDNKLKRAGVGNTEFMFEKKNGVYTGRIISTYDFDKYNEERNKYIEEVNNNNTLNWAQRQMLVDFWESKNSKEKKFYIGGGEYITQRVPLGDKPGDPYYKEMPELNKAQQEYYREIMKQRAFIESLVNDKRRDLFAVTYIRANLSEEIGRARRQGAKQVMKAIGAYMFSWIHIMEDEEEYGERNNVVSDMSGHEIKQVPLYYKKKLNDMSRLSSDFTGATIAALSSAANYYIFSRVADMVEMIRMQMATRKADERKYGEAIEATYKVMGRSIKDKLFKKNPLGQWMLDRKLDHLIYNRAKKLEGDFTRTIVVPTSINIFNKNNWRKQKIQIAVSEISDTLKGWGSQKALGFNIFSGGVNYLTGKVQEITEAAGGQFFGFKNLLRAHGKYWSELLKNGGYLSELYSTNKTSLMGLMEERFDTVHDFTHSLRAQGQYKGLVSRMIARSSPLFLNTMGEHLLHNQTMFAILDAIDCTINNKSNRLSNAFTVYKNKETGAAQLTFKTGTKDANGQELFDEAMAKELDILSSKAEESLTRDENIRLEELKKIYERTEDYLTYLQLRIRRINSELHGAFDDWDKGIIHRYMLGRMLLHFRQWMPAYFKRRYSSLRKDPILGDREGFYRTWAHYWYKPIFWKSLAVNMLKMEREYNIFKHSMKEYERQNIRKFFTEMAIWASLVVFNMWAYEYYDDKEVSGFAKYAMLMAKRLQADTSIGFDPVQGWEMTKRPIPTASLWENLGDLVDIMAWSEEIKKGKYEGLTKGEAAFIKFSPYTKNAYNFYSFLFDNDTSLFTSY